MLLGYVRHEACFALIEESRDSFLPFFARSGVGKPAGRVVQAKRMILDEALCLVNCFLTGREDVLELAIYGFIEALSCDDLMDEADSKRVISAERLAGREERTRM